MNLLKDIITFTAIPASNMSRRMSPCWIGYCNPGKSLAAIRAGEGRELREMDPWSDERLGSNLDDKNEWR
ncbi:MAG: hypothetical protein M1399_03730 [Actinobacteria bacterium]|nr:hypothetical protein [Actinomycetota bacterium]MCL5447499.1 hypothetical protein [Actinomycetota bacterium]